MTQRLWVLAERSTFLRADRIVRVHVEKVQGEFQIIATTTLSRGSWDSSGLGSGGWLDPISHCVMRSLDESVAIETAAEFVDALASRADQIGVLSVDDAQVHFERPAVDAGNAQ
ncbi:hypothetical protein AB0H58_32530 [Nocardia neocaledoniensis]|uniref:hypothetical protein n=1 Tax=Nocardia neocaledoniensis TaxID=236511 RepID=UPI00340815DC